MNYNKNNNDNNPWGSGGGNNPWGSGGGSNNMDFNLLYFIYCRN